MRKRWAWLMALAATGGCRDVDRFSTSPTESYCGHIVSQDFVLAGFLPGVCMRFTFDSDHLADKPGVIWTDNGFFSNTPLRPIPQLSHDPLLTFSFGEGREKNLLFAVDPVDPARGPSLFAVISLMHTGDTEIRLLRGAPGGAPSTDTTSNAPFFGVFSPLQREEGNCSAHTECTWQP